MKAKRKLSDLKENECIRLNSQKEAKKLKNLFKQNNITHWKTGEPINIVRTINNYFITVKSNCFTYNSSNKLEFKEYHVNDFITSKKSKLKKIRNEIRQELARFDNRINDLEVKHQTKNDSWKFSSILDTSIGLEEDKWYILGNNSIMFNEKQGKGYGINSMNEWVSNAEWIKHEHNREFRYASKEEVEKALIAEAERRGFKQGCHINNSSLGFCFNEIYKDSNLLSFDSKYLNIGKAKLAIFCNGIWAEIIEQPKQEEITELPQKWSVEHSPETLNWIRNNAEINGHCITESKYYFFPCDSSKSNYDNYPPEGYTIISLYDFDRLVLKKEQPKQEEIDWSVTGQLLQNIEYPEVVVMYSGSHKAESFNGIYLTGHLDLYEKGCYGSMPKKYFRLFNESVTISNE